MMRRFSGLAFLLAIMFFAGCDTIGVYEKTAALPKHAWSSDKSLQFKFTATDSLAYYNIFLVLRHGEAYHFNNIWIDFTAAYPGRKATTQRLNLQLTGPNGWLGTAMDDIIEQRVLLFRHPTKLAKGDYTFAIQQVMREDPLQNVLNAGIRIEKVVQ